MRKYDNVEISLGLMGKEGFRLLARQKRILDELRKDVAEGKLKGAGKTKQVKIMDTIDGLLNLLDHIQDQAVDTGQVPEDVVFPYMSKE